jgi:lipopolysaccharide biosynthesis regulator YciM
MPFSKQHSTGSLFIGLVSGLFLAGCASTGENAGIGLEDMAPIQVPSAKIHSLEVTTPVDKNPMYQMMVAELAVNSGDTELAVKNYLTLAESQNDPKIAERAVRIAVYAQDMDAAEKAAQRWIELQPDRTEPKQIIAAIFIRNDNPDMAFKYMEEVIKAQPSINEQTFMPLLGLLAREKNTATVLNVAKKSPTSIRTMLIRNTCMDTSPRRPTSRNWHCLTSTVRWRSNRFPMLMRCAPRCCSNSANARKRCSASNVRC